MHDLADELLSPRAQNVAALNDLPNPRGPESREKFMASCMTNTKMLSEFPDEKQREAVCFKQFGESENATNDARDNQRIETAQIVVPVIYVTVMAYKPGELGYATDFARRGGRVYYTPEAVSDSEFLESILTAPFSIASHEKNSSDEARNLDVGGWGQKSYYDKNQKCAMVEGVIIGADNVEYVKRNKTSAGFGSSADLSFLKLEIAPGVTETGEAYDAKVLRLCCNHVAILPNIRDSKNTIRAINATDIGVKNMTGGYQPEKMYPREVKKLSYKGFDITVNQFANDKFESDVEKNYTFLDSFPYRHSIADAIDRAKQFIDYRLQKIKNSLTDSNQNTRATATNEATKMADEKDIKDRVKDAMNDIEKESESARMSDDFKALSARMSEIEKKLDGENKRNAKNEDKKEEPENADEKEKPENADEKSDEAENAKNGAPSQATIKSFSEHYGIDFGRRTPSFARLGALLGISDKPFGEILTAVNAKRAEIEQAKPTASTAQNSTGTLLSGNFLSKLG